MTCPLCDCSTSRPGWVQLRYGGRDFSYVECTGCASLYCERMPDDATLAQMYFTGHTSPEVDPGACEAANSDPLLTWLSKTARRGAVFVDYGCGGQGTRLLEARRRGWQAIGVEFDETLARMAAERSGERIVSRAQVDGLGDSVADVVHLGDVIEHLTDAWSEMTRVVKLLKPGGLLIAQGPLEANWTLFNLALRTARRWRGRRPTEAAPYHVILATKKGQLSLFRRLGLEDVEVGLAEVSWPAPGQVSCSLLFAPRRLALYALRRVSQLFSKARPGDWGNRYFYVGRR